MAEDQQDSVPTHTAKVSTTDWPSEPAAGDAVEHVKPPVESVLKPKSLPTKPAIPYENDDYREALTALEPLNDDAMKDAIDSAQQLDLLGVLTAGGNAAIGATAGSLLNLYDKRGEMPLPPSDVARLHSVNGPQSLSVAKHQKLTESDLTLGSVGFDMLGIKGSAELGLIDDQTISITNEGPINSGVTTVFNIKIPLGGGRE